MCTEYHRFMINSVKSYRRCGVGNVWSASGDSQQAQEMKDYWHLHRNSMRIECRPVTTLQTPDYDILQELSEFDCRCSHGPKNSSCIKQFWTEVIHDHRLVDLSVTDISASCMCTAMFTKSFVSETFKDKQQDVRGRCQCVHDKQSRLGKTNYNFIVLVI